MENDRQQARYETEAATSHSGPDKMAYVSQTTFTNPFHSKENFVILIFGPVCSNDNHRALSCNDLTQNRCQAITSTNGDPAHWRIYASPGLNVLSILRRGSMRDA